MHMHMHTHTHTYTQKGSDSNVDGCHGGTVHTIGQTFDDEPSIPCASCSLIGLF